LQIYLINGSKVLGNFNSDVKIFWYNFIGSSSINGSYPVIISYIIIPKVHQSTGLECPKL